MRIVDVIKKKRDGEVLTTEEIKFFAKNFWIDYILLREITSFHF